MAKLLLVPVHMDALFLPEDTLVLDPAADFSRLPFFNGERDVNADIAHVSDNFERQPLSRPNHRLKAGLHLHWALPDALTVGKHIPGQDAEQAPALDYPAVPNRWIVHRSGGGLPEQTWVIESDFLWPEEIDLQRSLPVNLERIGRIGAFAALLAVLFDATPAPAADGEAGIRWQQARDILDQIVLFVNSTTGSRLPFPTVNTPADFTLRRALDRIHLETTLFIEEEPYLEDFLWSWMETTGNLRGAAADELTAAQAGELQRQLQRILVNLKQTHQFLQLLKKETEEALSRLHDDRKGVEDVRSEQTSVLAQKEATLQTTRTDKTKAENDILLANNTDIPGKQRMLDDNEDEIARLDKKIEDLQREKAAKTQQKDGLQKNAEALQTIIDQLKEERAPLITEKDELERLLGDAIENDDSTLATARTEQVNLKSTKEQEKTNLDKKIDALEERIAEIEEELDAGRTGSAAKRFDQAKQALEGLITQVNANEEFRASDIQVPIPGSGPVNQEMIDPRAKREEILGSLVLSLDALTQVIDELNTLEAEIRQLEAGIRNKDDEEEKQGLEEELQGKKDTVDARRSDLNRYLKALREVPIKDDNRSESRRQKLYQEWLSGKKEVDGLGIEKTNKEAEKEVPEEERQSVTTAITDAQAAIERIDRNIRRNTLIRDIADLNEQITPQETRHRELTTQMQTLQREIDVGSNGKPGLEKQIENASSEKAGLVKNNRKLTGELNERQASVEENRKSIKQAEVQIDQLLKAIFDLKREIAKQDQLLNFYDKAIAAKAAAASNSTRAFIDKRKDVITYPLGPEQRGGNEQTYRHAGWKLPAHHYDIFRPENFSYLEKLTAIGYGEPTFSAYYPNCKSLFGFHDNQCNYICDGLTYHLIGWYGDAGDDFLHRISEGTATAAELVGALREQAGWSLVDAPEVLADLPRQMLCFARLTTHTDIDKADFLARLPVAAEGEAIWSVLNSNGLIRETNTARARILSGDPNLLATGLDNLETSREAIIRALQQPAPRDFTDTTLTLADTGREALGAHLAHQLIPAAASFTNKKTLEKEYREKRARMEALELKAERFTLAGAEATELSELKSRLQELPILITAQNSAFQAEELPLRQRRHQIEDQLEALFLNDHLSARQLDVGAKFREARHANRFQAVSTGHRWTIRMESPGGQNAQQAGAEELKLPPLPDAIAASLQKVNAQQEEYDRLLLDIEADRELLLADWWKYMLSAYPQEHLDEQDIPDIDEVRYFIRENDLQPLYEKLRDCGRLFLNHPVQPSEVVALPAMNEDPKIIELLRVELDIEFDPNHDSLARTLAQTINGELLPTLQDHNIAQLLIQEGDLTNWADFTEKLQLPVASDLLGHLRNLLPDALRQLIDTAADPSAEERAAIRDALNDFLRDEDLRPQAAAVTTLLAGKLATGFTVRQLRAEAILPTAWPLLLQALRSDSQEAKTVRELFPVNIRRRIDRHPDGQAVPEELQHQLLTLLSAIVHPPQEEIVAYNRRLLEGAFGEAIRTRPKALYRLKRIGAPRYWEPKEPVVLLTGDIARPSERFGRDGRLADGQLLCHHLTIAPESDFAGFAEWKGDGDFAALQSLLTGIDELETPGIPQIGFRSVSLRERPWNPFLMEWEAELCPLLEHGNAGDGDYQADFITHNLELKADAVDLSVRDGKSKIFTGTSANFYSGRGILTHHAFKSMETALRIYLDSQLEQQLPATLDNPVHTAAQALEQLQQLTGLSQALSGFHLALRMLREGLNLPIEEPIGFADYQGFTKLVATLIGRAPKRLPRPATDFSPIRSGELRLNQLRVVDTFGQHRQIDFFGSETDMTIFGTATAPADLNGLTNTISIPLAPRLVQPARLEFRWLAAREALGEMGDHPASSPICGWLVNNHLDISIMIFDSDGKALGAIEAEPITDAEIEAHRADQDRSGWARWTPAPGRHRLLDTATIGNAALQRVVHYIRMRGAEFVGDLIRSSESVLQTIEPEGFERQQAMALLMGRPIAVVRASVDLAMKGGTAYNQSWYAFRRDRKDGDQERDTDQYMRVQYPIRIGAANQYNDGLIAYWLETKDGSFREGHLFVNQRAEAAPQKESGSYHADLQFLADELLPIRQTMEESSGAQLLTLLMDPRGKIHATTGILPRKAIDIPEAQFLPALQAMDITFQTAPIISPAHRIHLPLPEVDSDYHWCWVERTGADNYDEIYAFPTIERAVFDARFSALLWQQLARQGWIRTLSGEAGAWLRPATLRPALATEFAGLSDRLRQLLDELLDEHRLLHKKSFLAELQRDGGLASRFYARLHESGTHWLTTRILREGEPDEATVVEVVATADRATRDLPHFGLEAVVEAVLQDLPAELAPTAAPTAFSTRFADRLWQELLDRQWLEDPRGRGATIRAQRRPAADRQPLAAPAPITRQLETAVSYILESDFTAAAQELATALWTFLSNTGEINWLAPVPERADLARIVDPKHRRNDRRLLLGNQTSFAGLERVIDELFQQYERAIYPPFQEARFFEQRPSIREGWLKLEKTAPAS